MGNSSSSTSGAAAITVAAVAASAIAAWVFSSYLPLETMEPQNRSSETKESKNRLSETKESQNRMSKTTQDLNCLHVEGNFGASPIYDPETKASLSVKNSERHSKRQCDKSNEDTEVFSCMMRSASHISEREFALSEAHLSSLMAGVQDCCQAQMGSKKNYMQLDDQKFQKLKWKWKLKADVNNQIPRHLTPSIHLQVLLGILVLLC